MLERLVVLKIDQKYPDSGKITSKGIGAERIWQHHIEIVYYHLEINMGQVTMMRLWCKQHNRPPN